MSQDIKTYTVRVVCNNCDAGDSLDRADDIMVAIPLGVTMDVYLNTKPCPKCACTSLRKT